MEDFDSGVLDKLIRLHALSSGVVDKIYQIAISADDCKATLKSHEDQAGKLADGLEGEAASLLDEELTRLIEAEPRLRDAFTANPKLSMIEPATLAVLASIADVRPNNRGVPVTRDGPFSYVLKMVADDAGTTTATKLMWAFVRRLVAINAKFPDLIAKLRDLGPQEEYRELVNGFDDWLDQPADSAESLNSPSGKNGELVEACGPQFDRQADRALLYDPPRLSQIPMEFTRAFPVQQHSTVKANDPSAENLEKKAKQAQDVVDAMMALDEANLKRTIQIRLEAAKDFLTRRQFVKAQMLEFGWPQLAARTRTPGGMRRLRDLEKAVRGTRGPDGLSRYWKRLLNDERLADFLSIPPYFSEIPADEFAGITEDFTGTLDHDDVPGASDAGATALGPELVDFGTYTDIELIFNPVHNGETGNPEYVNAWLALKVSNRPEASAPTLVTIPVGQVRRMLRVLGEAYAVSYSKGSRPDPSVGRPFRDVSAAAFPLPDDVLEDIGNLLWNSILESGEAEEVRNAFNSAINEASYEHLRLIFTNNELELSDMPWECLYIPEMRAPAGLTLRTSVLRNIPKPVSLVRRSMGRPLRMLIVSSTPKNLPWINAEQEVVLLQRALGPAERAGLVRLEVLSNPDENQLLDRLRVVAPHIFHFIGHGAIQGSGEGVVALADVNGDALLVTASNFGKMLRDHGILLSVLNSCVSGGETSFDMARSIGRILVGHGVPVAISTVREVLDTVALQFAREFYIALVDGYPIEAATVEARKLLSVKGWDWSAYVLYAAAGSSLLDFRVSPRR